MRSVHYKAFPAAVSVATNGIGKGRIMLNILSRDNVLLPFQLAKNAGRHKVRTTLFALLIG